MFSLKEVRRNSGRTDEPRVGTVTKLYSNFGYIDDNIFFQKHTVIGPMVNVGDTVAAKAVFNPDLPIKWNAEQVWRVEPGDDRRMHTDSSFSRSMGRKDNRQYPSRDNRPRRDESERRHTRPGDSRSRSPQYSKTRSNAHTNDSALVTTALRNLLSAPGISNQLSSVRDLHPSDLINIYKIISPPVYLYRLKCLWQDSHPITQPFQSSKEVRFHQVNKMAVRLVNVEEHNFPSDPSYAVGVILLGCPPPNDLFENCVGSTSDAKTRPFTKCINMLTISQSGLRAVGGNWVPELDGQNPATNPRTLINTAIRACKDMIGLDLSECTRWYRFLEFRYSRSEGQAWPSVDQMFAKGERWGVAYNENGDHSATSASNNRQSTSTPSSSANVKPAIVAPTSPTVSFKDTTPTEEDADDKAPPHRVVVYFMPDIWSIMPDKGSWESIKAKYQDPKSYCTPKEPTTQSQCSDTGIDKEMDAQGDAESLGKEAEQEMRTSGKDNEAAEAMDTTEDIPRWKTEPVSGSPGQEEKHEEADNGNKPNEEEQENDPRKLHHSKIDINALKVSELREQLSARKLDTSGLKNQLSNRLKAALQNEAEEEEKRRKDEEERAAQAAAAAAKAAVEAAHVVAASLEVSGSEAVKSSSGTHTESDATKPSAAVEGGRPEIKLPVLPEQPSLIVQLKQKSACQLVVCSLETIITLSKGNYLPSNQVYELFVCANHILHMFHRDAAFTLYKSLVVLSDRKQLRSAQSLSKPKAEVEQLPLYKKPRMGSGDGPSIADAASVIHKAATSSSVHEISGQQKMRVVDLPLLFACKLLDLQLRGYFSLYNLETIVGSLALPISRYQIRALCHNVVDDNKRLHYRCLTDVPDSVVTSAGASSIKVDSIKDGSCRKRLLDRFATEHLELNGTPISNIDDEEYLDELVRGGDAILEDSAGTEEGVAYNKLTPVAVLGGTGVGGATEGDPSSIGEKFLKQLRRMENHILRLQQTVKTQNTTLSALRKENSEIPRLQEKLKKANSTADHYRSRCRDRRSILTQTLQQLEAQTCILESNCSALRSTARRVKRDLQADEASGVGKSQSSSRDPSLAPPHKKSSCPKSSGDDGDSRRGSDLKKEAPPPDTIRREKMSAPSAEVVNFDTSELGTATEDVIGECGVLDLELSNADCCKVEGGRSDVARDFDVNSEGSLECAPECRNGENAGCE